MRKLSYLAGLGLLLLSQLGANTAQAVAVFSVVPTSQTTTTGSAISVDINVSGLTSYSPQQVISAYDLLLGYDATYLDPTGVTFYSLNIAPGDVVSAADLNFDPDIANVPPNSIYSGPYGTAPFSTVEFAEVIIGAGVTDAALAAAQGDGFRVATITFNVIGAGPVTTLLDLFDGREWGPTALERFDVKGTGNGPITDVVLEDGSVTITQNGTQIPEPGTLALLLGGGLVGALRRWQAAKAA